MPSCKACRTAILGRLDARGVSATGASDGAGFKAGFGAGGGGSACFNCFSGFLTATIGRGLGGSAIDDFAVGAGEGAADAVAVVGGDATAGAGADADGGPEGAPVLKLFRSRWTYE